MDKDTIYRFENQPARVAGIAGELVEVYLGNGEWNVYDDPRGSFFYSSAMTPEQAKSLMSDWDKDAKRRDQRDAK